jgi:hypothetical protein
MGILPDSLFTPDAYGTAGRGGLLGALPTWLLNAQQFGLAQNDPAAAGAAPSNANPAGGDLLSELRAAIPQGLADNSNTLLAFGGGSLRGGIGKGLSDAAKVGLHETELLQRRKSLAAQQAATIQALRGAGLSNPDALAAMHPALARILLAHAVAKST